MPTTYTPDEATALLVDLTDLEWDDAYAFVSHHNRKITAKELVDIVSVLMWTKNNSARLQATVPGAGPGANLGTHYERTASGSLAFLESRARPNLNYLMNGGFDIAQRGTSIASVGADAYAADRWRTMRENANVDFARTDISSLGGTGVVNSLYGGRYTKQTSTGKMGICQILEGINSLPLRGKTVTFQCRMRASAALAMRIAVVELQTAGTMDTIPSPLITTWGADGVEPIYGTNLLAAPVAKANHGSKSCQVLTTYRNFSITVKVPYNSKNLVCVIHTESQVAAAVWFEVCEAGLYDGDQVRDWLPRPIAQELLLCQRYYSKSFLLATTPAQNIGGGTDEAVWTAHTAGANINRSPKIPFPVRMRATAPTVTLYSTGAASAQAYDRTAAAVCTGTSAQEPCETGFWVNTTANAGTAVGNLLAAHWTAEKEL